jgi:IstB-like ATP binding protein
VRGGTIGQGRGLGVVNRRGQDHPGQLNPEDPDRPAVDELGYLPFEPDAAHLFFQLVSRRYERGAMLVTSNRAVANGGRYSGIPWSRQRSSTACSTTVMC